MTQINKDTIQFHCQQLQDILIKKNHDYGNSVQDQFNEYGLTSILIRLDDKMSRLKNLRYLPPQVVEESLKDTLQDLAGYALLGLMCLTHQELELEVESNGQPLPFKPMKLDSLNTVKIPANFEGKVLGRKPPYADLDDE